MPPTPLWTIPVAALAVAGGYIAWAELSTDATEPDRLAAALGLKPGMTVAEIGAGDGSMALAIAESVGRGGDVFATELDSRKLSRLRLYSNRLSVLQGSERSTNLPPGCCDAIYMRHVYHHFSHPKEMAETLFKSLKPGGRLAVIDTDGKLWYLPRPNGVPPNRKGHGMPVSVLIAELKGAGFELLRNEPNFSRGAYLALFRRPLDRP